MLAASRSLLDRRVLGALELVDAATEERLKRQFVIKSDVLGFVQNRSGLWAINHVAPQTEDLRRLQSHLRVFDTAPTNLADGAVSVDVDVFDPKGCYIPRRISVSLPRGASAGAALQIPLYPSTAAPISKNWSGIRASLEQSSGSGTTPLVGARVVLKRDGDDAILGTGFSDERGEVLVVAVGIPVIDFSVTATSSSPLVGAKTVTSKIEIHTGPGQAWPPNPDAISSSGQAWVPVSGTLPKPELATGRIVSNGLSFVLQPQ